MMKSYIRMNSIHFQGKAWQIKMLLSQWQKEAGPTAKIIDVIHSRYKK
ncbi:hypothetical protein FHR92_005076 [Fontibacillus solani]|uniref:Z-ring formation inhibitor MciZ n=1 Tax=Fontibacillus solani TaxID=1572857 RepID=A0A7W3SYN0_9BACL|nr:Z-ring formation inhibitor MciZ [Fontibacillus solani]MBA9088559.1 hypothetical protein [Fontibacillus solani]